MEDWTGSSRDLQEKITDEISQCDFLVLLVGRNRGSTPTNAGAGEAPQSFVEIEYQHAKASKIPVIPLIKMYDSADAEDDFDRQLLFRRQLRDTLVTKHYASEKELGGYLSASLLALIRPLEQAVVLQTNADLVGEVARYLNDRARRKKPVTRAVLIQYTATNAKDLLRKLLWNGVKTDLFLSLPSCAINGFQADAIRRNVRELVSCLRSPLGCVGRAAGPGREAATPAMRDIG